MNFTSVFEELNSLYEDKVDETPVEEVADDVIADEPADEEPKQVVLECSKCGALVIKDEIDVAVDAETDLANADEACQYCEETEGYKIVGAVVPYAVENAEEPAEPAEEPVEAQLEESALTEGAFLDALKKAATRIGADAATVVRCFGELSGNEAAYDLTSYIENKAVLKALQSGNKTVFNTLTQDDIEDLAQDIADYERDRAHRKATKGRDFSVLVVRTDWGDGKTVTYDSVAYAETPDALNKYRAARLPYEKDEDIQIVSAKEAKKLTKEDITRSPKKFVGPDGKPASGAEDVE